MLAGGPQGIDRVWSSAPHDGVARALVGALKFRRLLPVAEVMAERMHWLVPGHLLGGAVVAGPGRARAAAAPRLRSRPVSWRRRWRRGSRPSRSPAWPAAARAIRSAAAAPSASATRPGSRPIAEAPRSVLLIDDVLTTGATLTVLRAGPPRARARSESSP